MTPPPRIAILGFGELGRAVASTLVSAKAAPRVWNRPRADPAADAALGDEVKALGAERAVTLAAAVDGAHCVIACLPGSAAEEIARVAAPALRRGAVYADLATAAPESKERSAGVIDAAGARFADGAVLGTAVASGGAVPIMASGPGAHAFAGTAGALGMSVTAVDAPAGAATAVKLLRSVYMKGRDALVAEMMIAAGRRGVGALVAESIRGPGEEVPFPQLAERILASLALHAARRADELDSSAQLLEDGGVDALATGGAARRLRALAELGLDRDIGDARLSVDQVLDLIERADAR